METKSSTLYSDKLAWGLTLVAISLLFELIVAGYGLANLGMDLDPSQYTGGAASINPLLIALSCLSPIGFLLKVVAMVLILQDSRRLNELTGGNHRRMVLSALIVFVLSLVIQISTTAFSFSGTMGGSQPSLIAAIWIGFVASMLGFAAVFLLVFAISSQTNRILLAVGMLVYAATTFGTTLMTAQNTTLQTYDMMGSTFYAPSLNLDRTQGIYPILSLAGTLAIALYLVVLAAQAIQAWRSLSSELPESVA